MLTSAPQLSFILCTPQDLEFKQLSSVEQLATHFVQEGALLWTESDEARRQTARLNLGRAPAKKAETKAEVTGDDDGKTETESDEIDAGEGDAEGGTAGDGDTEPVVEEDEVQGDGNPKPLRNQFNYSERASQTFNYTSKERGVQTEPPPRSPFSGSATQWEMYDMYNVDLARQAALKEKKKPAAETKETPVMYDRGSSGGEGEAGMWAKSAEVVKLEGAKKIERMTNQNTFDDVLIDFKYWDDGSDEYKPGGSLLPLWKFSHETTKKKTVTALCCHPQYNDMIAVGLGSYDYAKQIGGAVACYTLKGAASPEYIFQTESGVMSLDFHKESTNLLAVGFYDGSVAVYDLATSNFSVARYKSTAVTGKHTDPVWQVKWQPDDLEKKHNFCSVSSDGRVTSWTLVMSELACSDVILLTNGDNDDETPNDDAFGLGAGTCFAFNPTSDHLFLVGTEEGKINKCSKAYSSKYLSTYDAHEMPIYTVEWNKFHPRVFATASADWSVKIWEHEYPHCLFQFDLGASVGDVAWAPYSATVFAAVSTDGKVHVFDLSVSKLEPICVQPIVRKGRLTHIAFSPIYPVIYVGDDRGAVTSLKLSPNLRKAMFKNNPKKGARPDPAVIKSENIEKFEKLMDSVKELNVHTGKAI